MADYVHILHLETQSGPAEMPPHLQTIHDWTWRKTALVRWSWLQQVRPDKTARPSLVIIDWPSKATSSANTIYDEVRRRWPKAPILILKTDTSREANRDKLLKTDGAARALDLHELSDPLKIQNSFELLGVELPAPRIELDFDHRDLQLGGLLHSLGPEWIRLSIEKFFPDAARAKIWPVGGGWSGTNLCRLFISGGTRLFFLKFFASRSEYVAELRQHQNAKRWLGD